MKFDFEQFFSSQGVDYRTRGKNVKAGWVNLNCPFCGDDRGFHLGCDPSSGGFSCWRNSDHKGYATKLVKEIKRCSWSEAKRIVGDTEEAITPGGWAGISEALGATPRLPREITPLPREFKPLDKKLGLPFWRYLVKKRGFAEADIPLIARRYCLRYCRSPGDWAYRLIFPIVTPKGIEGWQGRAIGNAIARYKTYPSSDAAKRLLYNSGHAAKGGRVLTVVEGPIGAINIDYPGHLTGIKAVATIGVSFMAAQVAEIYKLAPKYDKLLLLFDPGAESMVGNLAARLSIFRPIVGEVPAGLTGPDEIPPEEVVHVIERMLR